MSSKLNTKNLDLYSINKNVYLEVKPHRFGWQRLAMRLFAKLDVKEDKRIVISEQSIEYPLLFQNLIPAPCTILDFGCVEGLLPIQLCTLGYKVTGLDFRPYPLSHPNFDFIQADILTWMPPEDRFDAVISISTIEHVGLGGYDDPAAENGDNIAVQKLFTACRPGGTVYLTVPAGQPCNQRNFRVYNNERIYELVPNIQSIRFFTKENRYAPWQETSAKAVDKLVYNDYYTIAPVQGVAFIVAEKE